MNVLLIIGIAAGAGFVAGKFFNKMGIPAVTGWVVMGVVLGNSMLGIFPEKLLSQVGILSDLALGFIAFNIGEELTFRHLKRLGKPIIAIVIFEAFGAFIVVSLVVLGFTHKVYEALILGSISSATAPAATVMVLQEVRAKGDLTTTILGIVAIDDAIALILYAFASAIAKTFISPGISFSFFSTILPPLQEIFRALLSGVVLGSIVSFFSRWTKSSTDFFIIIITVILINIGLSISFGFSDLLANMSLGMTVANLSPRSLRYISNIWQASVSILYIAFFCLAGAHLNVRLIPQIGILGLAYTGARMVGKFSGAYLGARVSHASKMVQKYVGFSLFPQVGVALALAVVVRRDFFMYGQPGKTLAEIVINILLFTTLITEIIGPYLTRKSLIKAGEARKEKEIRK